VYQEEASRQELGVFYLVASDVDYRETREASLSMLDRVTETPQVSLLLLQTEEIGDLAEGWEISVLDQ